MNSLCITGRLVKDPESRVTPTGKDICEFTVAVDKRFKASSGATADFFRCVAWSKTAEYASQYGSKGRVVEVTGSIGSERYTDKAGIEREVWKVNAEQVKFLDKITQTPTATTATGNATSAANSDDEYNPFAD